MQSIGLVFAALLCFLLSFSSSAYEPNWQSLDARPIPDWYDDAKFGIFIHFGLFSVPSWAPLGSYAEWYWFWISQGPQGRGKPVYDFHIKTYGPNFKYEEFAPAWQAELFDPKQWADLFARSGAKYIVPTSKHHDGFTLWKSETTANWNSVDVGPKRDIIGEIARAVRDKGLRSCVYFSLYEWFHPLYRGAQPREFVDRVMWPQLRELITTYKPEMLFTDGDWDFPSDFWRAQEFLAWLFNESPVKDTIVVNDRWGSECRGHHGGYYSPEYGSAVYLDHKWELNRGIDVFSFGFNRNSQAGNYSTTAELLHTLIRTVANGGNLLLNVGPSADGEIPVVMQERLLDIGRWLQVNGEAIYGTRMWSVHNDPLDEVFYTQRGAGSSDSGSGGAAAVVVVYALLTVWPDSETIVLPHISAASSIALLGYNATTLHISHDAAVGTTVQLPHFVPGEMPCEDAWVLKIVGARGPAATGGLMTWWGFGHDMAACFTAECTARITSIRGYERRRYEGLAFRAAQDGLVPLQVYHSDVYGDHALVTQAIAHRYLDSTYKLIHSVEGYIYPPTSKNVPGTVPLELWLNEQRKDFWPVGCQASRHFALIDGYALVTTIGYILPGPNYKGRLSI